MKLFSMIGMFVVLSLGLTACGTDSKRATKKDAPTAQLNKKQVKGGNATQNQNAGEVATVVANRSIVQVPNIANYSNDPYSASDETGAADTIENYSDRYTYAWKGFVYAIAKIETPATETTPAFEGWTVLREFAAGQFETVSNEDINALYAAVQADNSPEAQRFLGYFNRNSDSILNPEVQAQVAAHAATEVKGVRSPARKVEAIRVFDKGHIVGFAPRSDADSLDLVYSPVVQVEDNGAVYTLVVIRTEREEGFMGWSNEQVMVVARVIENLSTQEYAVVKPEVAEKILANSPEMQATGKGRIFSIGTKKFRLGRDDASVTSDDQANYDAVLAVTSAKEICVTDSTGLMTK